MYILKKENIFITKSFLPPKREYDKYVKMIYRKGILTNQGPLVKELEEKLKSFLGISYIHYLANGTAALQLALSALGINEGEIITTPFSYVATVSAILWQRCTPVFVDIEENNYTIDVSKIEKAVTHKTKAILAVHVFGYACAVDEIEKIAQRHGLKVIYDGAHAFGSCLNGKSLLSYGNISTLSFHATKLFHTIEGGACIAHDITVSKTLELQKRFGHDYDNHIMLGINAKCSEFHAAMGLANFKYIETIINKRKCVCKLYDKLLDGIVIRPKDQNGLEYNFAYYPVVFKSEEELLRVFAALNAEGIYPRRYFYPSLNKLPYVHGGSCPVSEDIAARIACLPLYVGLEERSIEQICQIIRKSL
jgi:dTDP-4-amino-4,6-dideoxygalactose transaminase